MNTKIAMRHMDLKIYPVEDYVEKYESGPYLPHMATENSAGSDLRTPVKKTLSAKSRIFIPLGIKLGIPKGMFGMIASKSGLSRHHGIECGAGIIDSDYKGEIGVILYNHSEEDYTFEAGDKVAQLIVQEYVRPEETYWISADDKKQKKLKNLDIRNPSGISTTSPRSKRTGGFGSTGKR